MQAGQRVRGDKKFTEHHLRYHAADKNGHMYWCDCAPKIRLGGKEKHCFMAKGSRR